MTAKAKEAHRGSASLCQTESGAGFPFHADFMPVLEYRIKKRVMETPKFEKKSAYLPPKNAHRHEVVCD